MKHRIRLTLAAFALAASAPAAHAAQYLTITGASGIFGNTLVGCLTGATVPCTFTTTFTFDAPAGFGSGGGDISSTAVGAFDDPSNLNFTSVTLNGTAFATGTTGTDEYRYLLSQPLFATGNTLIVSGETYGQATFSGTLAFAEGTAVPEPATWALMLVGFGAVGYSLRRRPHRRAQAI